METEDEGEEEQVMSEIHLGCSPNAKSHITQFTISPPVLPYSTPSTGDFEQTKNVNCLSNKESLTSQEFMLDEEGDLVLARRKRNQQTVRRDSILIHHHITTGIPSVGLQLGAGTGLVGIVLARAARTVFITDKGKDILDNCFRNVELNLHTYKQNEESVRIRQLDWQEPWPPQEIQIEECSTRYSWTSSDIEEAEAASVLLAADVVYSDELTDAFFKILCELMPLGSKKVLYLSLEKRYNFTMDDLDIVAHGYRHFRLFFTEDVPKSISTGCARDKPAQRESSISIPHFIGKQLDTASIPQYIQEYDRGIDAELWEIRAQPHESN